MAKEVPSETAVPQKANSEEQEQQMNASEQAAQVAANKSIPTRQYLDQTVVPILLQGLSTLAKERYVFVSWWVKWRLSNCDQKILYRLMKKNQIGFMFLFLLLFIDLKPFESENHFKLKKHEKSITFFRFQPYVIVIKTIILSLNLI